MKKMILVLLLAVMTSGSAFAQKGMMGVGANFGVCIHDDPFIGGGVKFQYNVADIFRIEPSFSYYGATDNHDYGISMAALINGHLFFSSPRAFRPYFFTGVGYVLVNHPYHESYGYYPNFYTVGNHKNEGSLGVNTGLGIDYRMSHDFSMQVEAGGIMGINYGKSTSIKVNIGVTYNF